MTDKVEDATQKGTVAAFQIDKDTKKVETLNDFTLVENGQRVYSPNNKPTPSDLGAIADTGTQTIKGRLRIEAASSHLDLIETDNADKGWRMEAQGGNLSIVETGVAGRATFKAGGGTTLSGQLDVAGDVVVRSGNKLKFPTANYSTGTHVYTQDAGQHGSTLVVSTGGNLVLGAGESGTALANEIGDAATEHAYVVADGDAFIMPGANTIADKKIHRFEANGNVTFNSGSTAIRTFYGSAKSYIARSAANMYLAANEDGGRVYLEGKSGPIARVDGKDYVMYHAGNKPSLADVNAAPAGFGLGGNGGRCPDEDCNKAVAGGFYAIYSNTTNTPEGVGPSGSKMLVVAWSSQHVTQTFYRVSSNRTWTRSSRIDGSGVVSWTAWAELYSTAIKPTADDIGAVDKSEVNFTSTGGYPTVVNKIPRVKADGVMEVGKYIDFHDKDSTADFDSRLEVVGRDLKVHGGKLLIGSSEVYHRGSKPTPAEVGAFASNADVKLANGKKIILPTPTYSAGAQIYAQDADSYGANLILSSGGVTVLGAGESGQAAANALADKSLPSGERLYLTSDDSIAFISGANAWADGKKSTIDKNGVMTLSNNLTVDKGGKQFTFGTGTSDTWLLNSKSGKYFQMKDDGSLQYDSKHIHYKGNPHTTGSMISESQALGVVDLNDYKTPGVYHQSSNANATNGFNYPVKLAGSLVVYAAAGIIQEYRAYNSSRLFRRAQYATGDWLAWQEDYNTSNVPSATTIGALPIYGGRILGSFEVAPAQGQNCINLLQKPNTGSNAIGVHGFTENGSAIQWGSGMYYSGGQPQYAYFGSGAEPWVNGLKVSQGEVTTNGTFIAGGYSITKGGFRVNKSEYPSMELHRVGSYAYLSTIDSAGHYVLGSSNGAGSLTNTCMRMSYAAVEFSGKVISTVPGRSWTESGQSGVYVQGTTDVSNGALQSAISMYSHYPNQYVSEALYGVLHGGDWASTVQVLSNYNGTNGSRSTWMFANSGTLTAPGSNWFIASNGGMSASIYGKVGTNASYLDYWVRSNFAPISDTKFKRNFKPAEKSALDDVKQIKFHSYDWNEDAPVNKVNVRTKIGITAQEMEALDECYTRDIETYDEEGEVATSVKALDVTNMLALALKAIQEQSEQIASLQAEVAELKAAK